MKAVLHFNVSENGEFRRTYKIVDAATIEGVYPSTHSTINILFNEGPSHGVDCKYIEFYMDDEDLSRFEFYNVDEDLNRLK